MTTNQPDRLDRIEQSLERSTQLLERVIRVQERTLDTQERTVTFSPGNCKQQQIQILLDAATRHEARLAEHDARLARQDALIERLDAIIERLIYREGRDGDPPEV